MKIPAALQAPAGIAALIIAPNRVLRGCSKKQYKQMLELEALVEESELRREAMKNSRPIRVQSTRV